MRTATSFICSLVTLLVLALSGAGQSTAGSPTSTPDHKTVQSKKKATGPAKEMGKGGEDIGKGAGKGSADLAKGTARGVGDLATGHPVDAAASVGKGAGGLGKNVGVGTGKGVSKIGKGVGGEFKKLGHKKGERAEKAK